MSNINLDTIFVVDPNKIAFPQEKDRLTHFNLRPGDIKITAVPEQIKSLTKHDYTVETKLDLGTDNYQLSQNLDPKYSNVFEGENFTIKQAYLSRPEMIVSNLRLVIEKEGEEHFVSAGHVIVNGFKNFFDNPNVETETATRYHFKSSRDKKCWEIYHLENQNLYIATPLGHTPETHNLPGWVKPKPKFREQQELRRKVKRSLHYPFNIMKF